MKPWDLWKFPYPKDDDAHWFVILSPELWCTRPGQDVVNALYCHTLRPFGRALKNHEVRLDQADGFDWDTVVTCAFIHTLPRSKATDRIGTVTTVRRKEIVRRLHDWLAA